MRVGFYTLGCKVSQYETEAIAESFRARGYTVSGFDEVCDVYVINTCTVTAESDRKSRQVIRRAKKRNPDALVLVCGCYSQRSPEEVIAIPDVDAVIGSAGKMALVDIADRLRMGESKILSVTDIDNEPFEKMSINGAARTRVYVKIEDGCECKCAYCAIPSARGRVRSKAREDVVREVEQLSKSGVCEVVLTGIETGSYGSDFDYEYKLSDLLLELDERRSCERIRLGSLAPELVGESFADRIKNLKSLAPHFHISVQSGSDNILRKMRRRYTRNTALDNIERLRKYIHGATFTTDLMVGFPGESEEDFLLTVDFVKRARFLDCHVFAYSKRYGTPAADFSDQVPENIKRERSERLIKECMLVRDSVLDGIIEDGAPLSCIFEMRDGEYFTGHSDTFVPVCVKNTLGEDLRGKMRTVQPVSRKDGLIFGELL